MKELCAIYWDIRSYEVDSMSDDADNADRDSNMAAMFFGGLSHCKTTCEKPAQFAAKFHTIGASSPCQDLAEARASAVPSSASPGILDDFPTVPAARDGEDSEEGRGCLDTTGTT